MIETAYYKIAPGRYVRQALSIWFGRWWWLVILPIACFVVWGMSDLRMLIVAIGLVMVVYPALIAMVYFNHALRPEAAFAVLSHKMVFNDRSMQMVFQPSDEHRVPSTRTYGFNDVKTVEDNGSSILIHLKSSRYDFIEIPNKVLSKEDVREVIKQLRITE